MSGKKYFSLESAQWERRVSSQETAAKICDSKIQLKLGQTVDPRVFLIDNVFLSLVKRQATKAWVREFWS